MREKIQALLNNIGDQIAAKNSDYGSSYFDLRREFDDIAGSLGFILRLGDKYNRLKALYRKGSAEVAESEEDTIRDIIGYCVLELLFREEDKNEYGKDKR